MTSTASEDQHTPEPNEVTSLVMDYLFDQAGRHAYEMARAITSPTLRVSVQNVVTALAETKGSVPPPKPIPELPKSIRDALTEAVGKDWYFADESPILSAVEWINRLGREHRAAVERASGAPTLPEPDFMLDGGIIPCYYAETVRQHVINATKPFLFTPSTECPQCWEIFNAYGGDPAEPRDDSDQPRLKADPASGAPDASTLPAFEDPQVQIVYRLIASNDCDPPAGEHWDGYIARRIVAALRAAPTQSTQQPEIVGYDPLEGEGDGGPHEARLMAQRAQQPDAGEPVKPLGWKVRTIQRQPDGELQDCFVEGPREGDMACGLAVLDDDYTGYGGVERKLEHCKMIAAWANAIPAPQVAQLEQRIGDLNSDAIRLHKDKMDALDRVYALTGSYSLDAPQVAQTAEGDKSYRFSSPMLPDEFLHAPPHSPIADSGDEKGIAWPTMPPRKGQSQTLFDDGYDEGWAKCIEACKASLAAKSKTDGGDERKPAEIILYNGETSKPYIDIDGNDLWMNAEDFEPKNRWKIRWMVDQARAALAAQPKADSGELANALRSADWSGVSIGNKALIQSAVAALAAQPEAGTQAVSEALGGWLSAALEDRTSCKEFKADIEAWFDAGKPAFQGVRNNEKDIEPLATSGPRPQEQEPDGSVHDVDPADMPEAGPLYQWVPVQPSPGMLAAALKEIKNPYYAAVSPAVAVEARLRGAYVAFLATAISEAKVEGKR